MCELLWAVFFVHQCICCSEHYIMYFPSPYCIYPFICTFMCLSSTCILKGGNMWRPKPGWLVAGWGDKTACSCPIQTRTCNPLNDPRSIGLWVNDGYPSQGQRFMLMARAYEPTIVVKSHHSDWIQAPQSSMRFSSWLNRVTPLAYP